jgi:hypothetical protein
MVEVTDKAREATARYYMPLAAAGERMMQKFSEEQLAFALEFLKGAIDIQQKALDELAASSSAERGESGREAAG